MNPDFKYTEFNYKTEDVNTLKTILECNNRRISAALSIAIDDLFLSIPEQHRAIFIVEKCEDIISGKTEPEGSQLKQFNFTKTHTMNNNHGLPEGYTFKVTMDDKEPVPASPGLTTNIPKWFPSCIKEYDEDVVRNWMATRPWNEYDQCVNSMSRWEYRVVDHGIWTHVRVFDLVVPAMLDIPSDPDTW